MSRLVTVPVLVFFLNACAGEDATSTQTPSVERAAPSLPPDGSRDRPFLGHGVITEIRGDIIQIDHERIPGFMAAVTMDFPLEVPALAEGLEPGQEVIFSIERTTWSHRIIRLDPAP